jgi:hypothetical protein
MHTVRWLLLLALTASVSMAQQTGGGGVPAGSGGSPTGAAGGSLSGTYPNPGLASPLSLSSTGAFSAGAFNSYLNSLVNGCNPATQFYNVQYSYGTFGVVGCVTGPASSPGAGLNQVAGLLGIATSTNVIAVGGSFYGFALANNASAFGSNPLVQDVAGLTSNVGLVGEEVDVQPYNAPSAYAIGAGIALDLVNNTNNGGTYPFSGIQMSARVNGGSTPAYWTNGISFLVGSISPVGTAINLNAIGTATSSSGNYNCPPLLNAYEAYWNGSANAFEGWAIQCVVSSGINPSADYFQITHGPGTAPAGQTHYFELTNGIELELDGSTSGSAVLSVAPTGGTLNLGSTNATVNTSGNLTVASVKAATYTVSTLPSASTLGAGALVVVTDATSFTPGTCTGGGSDTMIAVSNGTSWSCH